MYSRYKNLSEAQIALNGWDLATARRNYEQIVRNEHQHFLPDDHLLFSGVAPEAVSLKITEAPAEFAVPVKQDRRLSPNFRVRVEVKYRQRVSFALTLKAHVITQQEKDNILAWCLEDSADQDKKKPVTELKGTTCITHHFEANAGASSGFNAGRTSSSSFQKQDLSHMGLEQRLFGGNDIGMYTNQGQRMPTLLEFSHMQPHQQLMRAGDKPSPAALLSMWSSGDTEIKTLGMDSTVLLKNAGNGLLYNGNSGHIHNLDGGLLQPMSQLQHQPQYSSHFGSVGTLNQGLTQSLNQGLGTNLLGSISGPMTTLPEPTTVVQDFEFTNLEFVKPTRMNKVYMLFACTIMDLDTLFVVFNVPTIGICRAEQREKACQKLGVQMPLLGNEFGVAVKTEPGSESTAQRKREAAHQADSDDSEGRLQPIKSHELPGTHTTRERYEDEDMTLAGPRSRFAMREWLLEEYENTGLTRKLSQLDIQALLSQAGFPMDSSSDHASISQVQWEEFQGQFRNVLNLLRQISTVWNLEDPCVISGFDMDRVGTVQALAKEPAGTFICRFSMSQPGCLVLSCKTIPGHPKADADSLIHAIIKIDDLYERRVDTWIRDFAGATHVLDVYRLKRVDKRKVFASNYMRLKGLEQEGAGIDFGVPGFPEPL